MARTQEEHTLVSGKAGLGHFCPPARHMKIFASHPKIMFTDTIEM